VNFDRLDERFDERFNIPPKFLRPDGWANHTRGLRGWSPISFLLSSDVQAPGSRLPASVLRTAPAISPVQTLVDGLNPARRALRTGRLRGKTRCLVQGRRESDDTQDSGGRNGGRMSPREVIQDTEATKTFLPANTIL